MQVLVSYRTHLGSQLVGYQALISRYANEYPFAAWYGYDAAFRQHMAINPMLAWNVVNDELFNVYLRSASVLPSVNVLGTPGQL